MTSRIDVKFQILERVLKIVSFFVKYNFLFFANNRHGVARHGGVRLRRQPWPERQEDRA